MNFIKNKNKNKMVRRGSNESKESMRLVNIKMNSTSSWKPSISNNILTKITQSKIKI